MAKEKIWKDNTNDGYEEIKTIIFNFDRRTFKKYR